MNNLLNEHILSALDEYCGISEIPVLIGYMIIFTFSDHGIYMVENVLFQVKIFCIGDTYIYINIKKSKKEKKNIYAHKARRKVDINKSSLHVEFGVT